MTSALERRVEILERERGGGTRIIVVNDPPTPDEQKQIDEWNAEGAGSIIRVRNPFLRPIFVRSDVQPKEWDR